jgi:hypothetical protein
MLNLDTLIGETKKHRSPEGSFSQFVAAEVIFCRSCMRARKMSVRAISTFGVLHRQWEQDDFKAINLQLPNDVNPSVLSLVCESCEARVAVLLYVQSGKVAMAAFSNCLTGPMGANIPKAVSYFVDQAVKALAVGSKAACIAMFRAAVEQLLDEEGFTGGMLNDKLISLSTAVTNQTAPAWAKRVSTPAMDLLRKLGNEAVHPSDFKKLESVDLGFLAALQIVVSHLLNLVYEQPAIRERRLHKLMAIKGKVT